MWNDHLKMTFRKFKTYCCCGCSFYFHKIIGSSVLIPIEPKYLYELPWQHYFHKSLFSHNHSLVPGWSIYDAKNDSIIVAISRCYKKRLSSKSAMNYYDFGCFFKSNKTQLFCATCCVMTSQAVIFAANQSI